MSNPLEEQFKNTQRGLVDFYEMESREIPREEEISLLPILNSLRTDTPRYEDVELIAEGAEKRITRVYDRHLDREVAMAHALSSKTENDQEQFLREARLEANLVHPNITAVHNMGIADDGVPFFTMELLSGDSLKMIFTRLQEGEESYKQKYPLESLLGIYLKVCDAIAYAHSRNVLHLDIKPDNIRIGEFGEVFVCDWGLARILFNEEQDSPVRVGELDGDVLNDMTQTGVIKGTPGFMAPEQTMMGGERTVQTDVYSLGALLYMLLTHELPVRGSSVQEIIKNTRAGKLVHPHVWKKDRQLPRGLVAVAMKALALHPEDRYGSVRDLHDEISRYLAGFPTRAERANPFSAFSLLVRRHSRIASLLIFFLVFLGGVIGVTLVMIDREKKEAIAARELAEKNLSLYLNQKEEAFVLGSDLDALIRYAANNQDFSQARLMIRILQVGLDRGPSEENAREILSKKGVLHFISQEFGAANQCFERAGSVKKDAEECWVLSRKYVGVKPNDLDVLTTHQLTEFIKDSKGNNNRYILELYYHHFRGHSRPDPEEYLLLADLMLHQLNRLKPSPTSPRLRLTRKAGGLHLDLSGSRFSLYTLSKIGRRSWNVLSPFRLHSLDISDTPLAHTRELNGLRLKRLRMTGVSLATMDMLPVEAKNMGLETLIVDRGAVPEQTLSRLRKVCEVIEE